MNLPHLVTSLELSKRLKELGVKQDSLFYWNEVKDPGGRWSWVIETKPMSMKGADGNSFSAYTAGELGEMLPNKIGDEHLLLIWKNSDWNVTYEDIDGGKIIVKSSKTLADGMALMLIHLLTSNLITLTK